jgi:hypothetical protein
MLVLFLFIDYLLGGFLATLQHILVLAELMLESWSRGIFQLVVYFLFAFAALHPLEFGLIALIPICPCDGGGVADEVVDGGLVPHAHGEPLGVVPGLEVVVAFLSRHLLLLVLPLQVIRKCYRFV